METKKEKKDPKVFSWEDEAALEYCVRTNHIDIQNFGGIGNTIRYHVRGLNAQDLEEIRVSSSFSSDDLQKYIMVMLKAHGGQDAGATEEAIKKLFPDGSQSKKNRFPELIAKYKTFHLGSAGQCEIEKSHVGWLQVIKFFKNHPRDADLIVQEIQNLTNLGALAKKKPSISGEEQT